MGTNWMGLGVIVLTVLGGCQPSGRTTADKPILTGAPAAQANQQAPRGMNFAYEYQSGSYVRRMTGTVPDPQGLWDALRPLQPPPGASGGYGLLGDDKLLGQEPGFGLRKLGAVARKYLTIETLHVEQPDGWWRATGAQAGTFEKTTCPTTCQQPAAGACSSEGPPVRLLGHVVSTCSPQSYANHCPRMASAITCRGTSD